jgi:hypothetical protein
MELQMSEQRIVDILRSVYDSSLKDDQVLDCYFSFLDLFLEQDLPTTSYLLSILQLTKRQRLQYRNKLAELGFELTPNELNQYIFLLIMALNEYVDLTDT